jgi:hypothetical protein
VEHTPTSPEQEDRCKCPLHWIYSFSFFSLLLILLL